MVDLILDQYGIEIPSFPVAELLDRFEEGFEEAEVAAEVYHTVQEQDP